MKSILLFGLAAVTAGALASPQAASARPAAMAAPVVDPGLRPLPDYRAVGQPFTFESARRRASRPGFGRRIGLVGGWGGLYDDPAALRDAGFFTGPAEAYSDGVRVRYDYDRGYPYDWYRERSARTALPMAAAGRGGERRVSCSIEAAGVRVCRGQR
jgi:hypothetical protein